jgi:demethylspheroidene O-methyltransferase
MAAGVLPAWRERWFAQRDRWLASPRFREFASRFVATRPLARQRASELFDLVAGFVYTQWLLACVELKLFDRLAAEPLHADRLAAESRLPPASAQRLLEAASALGLAQARGHDADGRALYGLGPLGATMVGNEALTAMVEHHRTLYADLADPLALLREGRGSGAVAGYWSYAASARACGTGRRSARPPIPP